MENAIHPSAIGLAQAGESLRGQHAVVTGAGSGIGRATVIGLAAAGAHVLLVDRTEDDLVEVFEQLGGESAGHLTAVADVSCEQEMRAAYEQLAGRWDGLGIVVANAGINGVWAPLDQLQTAEWDTTLAINLRGTFLTVKLALPYLRQCGGGSVIIVSSVNGNRVFSNSGATAYACSKAAQVAFAKMIALELAREAIRVNVICPGAIHTKIHQSTERRDTHGLHLPVEFPKGDVPLTEGQPGYAADVAAVIAFLASKSSTHISGSEIYVDGAQSLLQG